MRKQREKEVLVVSVFIILICILFAGTILFNFHIGSKGKIAGAASFGNEVQEYNKKEYNKKEYNDDGEDDGDDGDGDDGEEGDGDDGDGDDGEDDDGEDDDEITLSDPSINVNGEQTETIEQQKKFNITVDITNDFENQTTIPYLTAKIYNYTGGLVENITLTNIIIGGEMSYNDYIIGESYTDGWANGTYTLEIKILDSLMQEKDMTTSQFIVEPIQMYYAISLSQALSSGVEWNITSLPVTQLAANANNGTGSTYYDVEIQAYSTTVDLYIKARSALKSQTGNTIIPLSQEKLAYNTTNSTVPETPNSLTTNFSDNLIGANLTNASKSYLKFYLDVSGGQEVGIYNNTIEFKAVISGQTP